MVAYRFGFKKGHSTVQFMSLLKRTVDYYRQRGSHIFARFVDFKKAFDRINYWKLFRKLLDDGINANIVVLLALIHIRKSVCVGAMLSLTVSQFKMMHDREEFCRHSFRKLHTRTIASYCRQST